MLGLEGLLAFTSAHQCSGFLLLVLDGDLDHNALSQLYHTSQTDVAVLNVTLPADSAVHSSAIARTVLNVLKPLHRLRPCPSTYLGRHPI